MPLSNGFSYNSAMPQDIICLSHLRWGFVYQRPQHLLSRFSKQHRLFFIEEPLFDDGVPRLEIKECPESGVRICVPYLPHGLTRPTQETIQKLLLNNLLFEQKINDYLLWYYTPMALSFSAHLEPRITVFDCMDELSAFKGAPQEMKDREAELMRRADLVLTGGQSLYEAKVGRHQHLYAFPSSIDYNHFAQARRIVTDAEEQASIPHPRIGFCGVIDERMDLELLDGIARLRPEYQFVMIGPVVKIDPQTLPNRPNIHYLGGKSYKELPVYMAGWDVAILPFAHNESTRYISPTKTPEYLAAGKTVVSTSITDVVRPYGEEGLVRIADSAEDFVAAIDGVMLLEANSAEWRARVDDFLSKNSWDITWSKIRDAIVRRVLEKEMQPVEKELAAVRVRSSVLGD